MQKGRKEPALSEIFDAVRSGFERVERDISQLSRRVGTLEERGEELQEMLDGVARAIGKDSLTILNHEQRIAHLEKARG